MKSVLAMVALLLVSGAARADGYWQQECVNGQCRMVFVETAPDGPPVSEAYLVSTGYKKLPQTAEPPLAVPVSETFYAARFPRVTAFVAKQPVRTLAKRLLRPLFFFRCR